MIDFSQLGPVGDAPEREVDPIKLFQALKVTDPSINDLWLAQGDALRGWHDTRSREDIAIVLNTGAGKTLVGLVAAQSLVNELRRQVVYVCASIQLIEQTASKAAGYGLDVTTYFRGSFSNDLYQRALAPCLTTYQALFNGKSRFRRDEVGAVVFDDAHTASSIIRDLYTLVIDRSEFSGVYDDLAALYRPYMVSAHKDVPFDEAVRGQDHRTSWLIPPFANRAVLERLKGILQSAEPSDHRSTKFVWEHLAESLDLCAVFISGTRVTFTPPVVPIRTQPYMQTGVRRLYLSATLAAGDVFLRSFGRAPDEVIAPKTTAGECERMILFPSSFRSPEKQSDHAVGKQMIEGRKAVVIVPSHYEGAKWDDVVTADLGDDVTEQVETFKKKEAPACLRLVARYDGVDLPGETCRMMIIDGLPSGMGPLEKFMWEQLRIRKVLRSGVASRIVQSFGRISRGMSDYGAVVVVGNQLVNWIVTPANQDSLPAYLRSQIQVGFNLSKGITLEDGVRAPDMCLDRDKGWVEHHAQHVRNTMEQPLPQTDDEAFKAAAVEVDFGHSLWGRDPAAAAKILDNGRDDAFKFSSSFGAWLLLWNGYALELAGDSDSALELYRRARRASSAIPPYPTERKGDQTFSIQVENVAAFLSHRRREKILARFDAETAALSGNLSVARTEEAVRCLGSYLGLDSSRPEKETGTGPDVLWGLPNDVYWAMELKTDKTSTPAYWKKEVMQLHDHVSWVQENVAAEMIVPVFVGPRFPADEKANPKPDTIVVELAALAELAVQVRAAMGDTLTQSLPLTVHSVANDLFSERGLLWDELSGRGISTSLLIDLEPLAPIQLVDGVLPETHGDKAEHASP